MVTATSGNLALVPTNNIVLAGSGNNRSVQIQPAPNQFGTALITLTVRDADGGSATEPFLVTVNSANDLPTISAIADQTIAEDGQLGPLAFTVGDVETPVANLVVTPTSGNLALVPTNNILLAGSGSNRTVQIQPAPNQFGTAWITLTVRDADGGTATEPFLVTVNSVNDLPTISVIADQTIAEDSQLGPLIFTVGDVETPVANLVVTATSDNLALVPTNNIVLSGSGTNRTVQIQPAPNQFGTAWITLTVRDADGGTATEPFLVTINSVNDLPAISAIADQTIAEDSQLGPLAFTVGDVETPVANLVVTATSGNLALVPTNNIVLAGSGSNRTVQVLPAPNQFGTALITLTVRDADGGSATEPFLVTINSVNDLPTISVIADQTVAEDSQVGPLAFSVGDVETPVANLVVTATSDNLALVPTNNIVLSGSGTNRTVQIQAAPNQFGTALITLTVRDADGGSATEPFLVTVNSVNDLPTISAIADQTIAEDGQLGPLAFTVGDVETPVANLVVTPTSGNLALVPTNNILLAGSGNNRTVQIQPAPNQFGTALITLTVRDADGGSATEPFLVTVNSVNDLPTISAIADQTIAEDSQLGPLAFTLGMLKRQSLIWWLRLLQAIWHWFRPTTSC